MFASTNLIVELGLMILILLGWEFLVAELLGGLILIAVMAVIVQLTLPETLFEEVRTELNQRDHDHGVTEDPTCGMEGRDEYSLVTDGGETLKFCSEGCMETYQQEVASSGSWRDELLSWVAGTRSANQYRKEWSMLYTDVIAGFLISGFVIVFVPQWVWNTLFFCRATASLSALRTQSWAWLSLLLASSVAWKRPVRRCALGWRCELRRCDRLRLCRPHYSPRAQRLPEVLRLECDAVYPRRVLRDDGIHGVSHGTAI